MKTQSRQFGKIGATAKGTGSIANFDNLAKGKIDKTP